MRIIQTDPRLPENFNKYACNFMSLGGIVQTHAKVEFNVEDLLYVFSEAVWLRCVDRELMVHKPDQLLKLFLKRCKMAGKLSIYQIGRDNIYWMWVKQRDYQSTILCGMTIHGNTHFREGDSNAKLVYDPNPSCTIERETNLYLYQVRSIS